MSSLSIALAAVLFAFSPRGVPAAPLDAAPAATAPASPARADTVEVVISLAERLHNSWARATVIRSPGRDALDIIVVTEETTPADLDKAIHMYLDSLESLGADVDRELRAHVSPRIAEVPEQALRVAAEYLERVRTGEMREIPEFGPQPSIVVEVFRDEEAEESGEQQ